MRTYRRTRKARYLEGLKIAVEFEDGTHGVFDFSPFADYPCYRSLKSIGVFSSVKADHGTLMWPGEIDIAPEAVWEGTVRESAAE